MAEVRRSVVIAFRLARHHLAERAHSLLDVAGTCAIQNSPPGSALLALGARLRGLTAEHLQTAAESDKSLLQTWSMRGAPHYFPTTQAGVFTTGVLPPTEDALRHFLPGLEPSLNRLGLGLSETVDLVRAEIGDVLTGEQLTIEQLGAQISPRIAAGLNAQRRALWESAGPYAPGQPLGEAMVHFCIRILALQGVVCFAPRDGNQARFVLVRQWLGHDLPEVDPAAARAELLRRYLHCYGPSTPQHFAQWLGVHATDTGPWWEALEDELAPVAFRGTSWLLTEDLAALRSAHLPHGVRLLPPHDPYTQMRDRDTIVDPTFHRQVWQSVGDPGTVLLDGEIVGTWRPRKRGTRLSLTVQTFRPLPTRAQELVRTEAETMAVLRDATLVDVAFDPWGPRAQLS